MTSVARRVPNKRGLLALPLAAVLLYACGNERGPTPPEIDELPVAQTVIQDFEAERFLWLPPLGTGKPKDQRLGKGYEIDVEICNLTEGTPCEVQRAAERGDRYETVWDSDREDAGDEFRIRALLGGTEILGKLTLVLDGVEGDAGREFPIKFFAGRNLVPGDGADIGECIAVDRCEADLVPASQETEIVTRDEDGDIMAVLRLPPGAAPEDLVVTLDCRSEGFEPAAGPLPTVLDQWPLFCHVDARLLDGTPFTDPLNADATIEICVVDNTIGDQAPYHGFPHHDDLRLGKYDESSDELTMLPIPSAAGVLTCAGIETTLPDGGGGAEFATRILEGVGAGLAVVLGPVLPTPLTASAAFRDGGVTGLVRSFSHINPVEPAFVGGSIEGFGETDLSGVSLELSGEFLSEPVQTTAGADGSFSFDEQLLAGDEPGTVYTVTLNESTLPSGAVVASAVNVLVDGTGTFDATFVAAPPAVVACIDADRCDADVVPANAPQATVITTRDENGLVMAVLTIPANALPDDVIVTLDCRSDGYGPGDGPLPTALNQWPLFCHVDASTLEGAPYDAQLDPPGTIEICTVDDEIDGQEPYHDFEHGSLVLGKSDNGEDFVFLDPVAGSFESCAGRTTTIPNEVPADVDGFSFMDWVRSGVGAVSAWVMPEALHATAFRDGGVTGLVRSFSDINPVEPAHVDGSVTAAGVGLANVTVQLSGGLLEEPLPTAVTAADGSFSFDEPLWAAEGGNGTAYTVEVAGGLPQGVFTEPEDVTVTGSGTFSVEIEAVGVLFDGGTVAGGSGTAFEWQVGQASGTAPAPFATPWAQGTCGTLDPIVQSDVGTDAVWPLGSNGAPSVITLTKSFYVPSGVSSLTLTGWVDNDAKVFIYDAQDVETNITGTPVDGNGWKVHDGCANLSPLVFTASGASFTPGAVNTLVIFVQDRGSVGYADFELAANSIIIN